MAKLVDALASGASVRKNVQVRLLFWAHKYLFMLCKELYCCLGYNRGYKES